MVESITLVWTDYDEAKSSLWLERTAEQAAKNGIVSRGEADSWVADLRRAGTAGTFFATAAGFTVYGRKR